MVSVKIHTLNEKLPIIEITQVNVIQVLLPYTTHDQGAIAATSKLARPVLPILLKKHLYR